MRFRAGSDGGFCFQEMGGRAAKRFHARFVEYVRIMGRRGLLLSFLLCFFFAMLPVSLVVAEEYAMHGTASWYGTSAHGKQTASGERFDRYSLTAAHKTLPFGTVLRVYNLKNRSHTLVRVADRGPFVKGRIVDVSRRAAEQMKMTRAGVATVAIEAISNAPSGILTSENRWLVEIAARLMARMREDWLTGAELSQLTQCLGRLGWTPVDRSKVPAAKDEVKEDPFAEFRSH